MSSVPKSVKVLTPEQWTQRRAEALEEHNAARDSTDVVVTKPKLPTEKLASTYWGTIDVQVDLTGSVGSQYLLFVDGPGKSIGKEESGWTLAKPGPTTELSFNGPATLHLSGTMEDLYARTAQVVLWAFEQSYISFYPADGDGTLGWIPLPGVEFPKASYGKFKWVEN